MYSVRPFLRFRLQHPNMGNLSQPNNFNATAMLPFGNNNTAAFWGRKHYNDWLVSASAKTGPGLLQSELIFGKGSDFTLSGGWPFPKVGSPPLHSSAQSSSALWQ